jgi:hypothetical protein
MFLNPLYSSLEYDDYFHDEKIVTYDVKMFDESINPILDIQTSTMNLRSLITIMPSI